MDPFIGQIMLFAGNFPPKGWALCDGQLLSITQNSALFAIIGTFYGGDGVTTFALPDLRGRVPIHQGQGPGLSSYTIGEVAGTETVTLTASEMPVHEHTQPATNGVQTTNRPNGALPAEGGVYSKQGDGSAFLPTSPAGNGQPHENRQPFLVLNYIIALFGVFPSRN